MGLNLETYIGLASLISTAVLAFLAGLDLSAGSSTRAQTLAWLSLGVAVLGLILYVIAHLRKGRLDWHDIAHYIVFGVVIVLSLIAALDNANPDRARTLLYVAAGVAIVGLLLGVVLDVTVKTKPTQWVQSKLGVDKSAYAGQTKYTYVPPGQAQVGQPQVGQLQSTVQPGLPQGLPQQVPPPPPAVPAPTTVAQQTAGQIGFSAPQ